MYFKIRLQKIQLKCSYIHCKPVHVLAIGKRISCTGKSHPPSLQLGLIGHPSKTDWKDAQRCQGAEAERPWTGRLQPPRDGRVEGVEETELGEVLLRVCKPLVNFPSQRILHGVVSDSVLRAQRTPRMSPIVCAPEAAPRRAAALSLGGAWPIFRTVPLNGSKHQCVCCRVGRTVFASACGPDGAAPQRRGADVPIASPGPATYMTRSRPTSVGAGAFSSSMNRPSAKVSASYSPSSTRVELQNLRIR
jgi:hypothetical protein